MKNRNVKKLIILMTAEVFACGTAVGCGNRQEKNERDNSQSIDDFQIIKENNFIQ